MFRGVVSSLCFPALGECSRSFFLDRRGGFLILSTLAFRRGPLPPGVREGEMLYDSVFQKVPMALAAAASALCILRFKAP